MAFSGADTAQLRDTARLFTRAAEQLQSSMNELNGRISSAGYWRGADSDRFRSEWSQQSIASLKGAIAGLRVGAETLIRHAQEQTDASEAGGASDAGSTASRSDVCYEQSARGLNDMWNEVRDIPGEGSGYRLQKVEGPDGEVRYIVYIAGTTGGLFANQSAFNNVHAVGGRLDEAQVKQLEKLIPEGAEVMLVGYSQGGMDAQNIAQSGRLNVTQVVTFGSPVRSDLEVPAVHLRATGDGVPGSAAGTVGPYFDSELAAEKDMSIFRGESPSHRPNGVNGIDVHSNGYGELAKSFDREADNGNGRQKAAVAGLERFQGNVLSEKDIR